MQSEELKKAGKYGEAEIVLSRIIDRVPPSDRASGNDLRISTGDHEINLSYLLLSRAGCRYELKQFDAALVDYEQSYTLEENAGLLYFIADCLYEQERYTDAIEKFDEYLKSANLDWKGRYLALRGRAVAVFQKGDFELAIHNLEMLKTEFPDLNSSIQNTIDQCISEAARINALKKKQAAGFNGFSCGAECNANQKASVE